MKKTEGKIEAEMERQHFRELIARLQNSSDPAELDQIKKELARPTFGPAVQS